MAQLLGGYEWRYIGYIGLSPDLELRQIPEFAAWNDSLQASEPVNLSASMEQNEKNEILPIQSKSRVGKVSGDIWLVKGPSSP